MIQGLTISNSAVFLTKLSTLYIYVFVGFVAGRFLKVERGPIARLLIYLIVPFVIFHTVIRMPIMPLQLVYPIAYYLIGAAISVTFFYFSKFLLHGPSRNVLAFSVGTGNTGYFGLPVAIMLFGDGVLPIVGLTLVGMMLFENTVGFYITSRGSFTVRQSIVRCIRLPGLYAFSIALCLNFAGIHEIPIIEELIPQFRGAYTLLGMMMIGLGLADLRLKQFNLSEFGKFFSLAFAARWICWPLLMSGFIALDLHVLHLFDATAHSVMFLMSIVPLPANAVTLAIECRLKPELAAVAVLASTVVSLPIIWGWIYF